MLCQELYRIVKENIRTVSDNGNPRLFQARPTPKHVGNMSLVEVRHKLDCYRQHPLRSTLNSKDAPVPQDVSSCGSIVDMRLQQWEYK